jgi:predicted CXXCH cytochrome family protein
MRVAAVSVLAALGIAAAPDATPDLGLSGTKHDFTLLGLSEAQKCSVCHTPSAGDDSQPGALWDQSEDAGRSYKLYDSSRGVPGSGSLLCLSCHDGSSAIDAFGGMDMGDSMEEIGGARAVIGRDRDLTGDHPVGVAYPDFDRDYRSRVVVEKEGYVQLPDGRVECLSCHDAHGQSGIDQLLVKSNVRSALCLTCHRK